MLERFGEPIELPEEFLDREIARNMDTGSVKYTTPWSMIVNEDNRCFINGLATTLALTEPMGTLNMKIERLVDGFRVYPPQGNKWKPGKLNIVGVSESDLIPVVEIVKPVVRRKTTR